MTDTIPEIISFILLVILLIYISKIGVFKIVPLGGIIFIIVSFVVMFSFLLISVCSKL